MAIHSTSNSKNNDIAASKPTDKVTKLEKNTSSLTLEDQLSFDLITAQTTLREQRAGKNSRGLLILVNGMENSGKGEAVKALTEWMDARYIKVHATMGQHPSRYQPIWQRHTWQLPRKGEIAVYFGNWYADLIRYVFDCGDDIDEQRLQQMIEDIEAFEQDLVNNNTDIVKCLFWVDNKTLKKRLTDEEPDPEQLYHLDWFRKKDVKRFKRFSSRLMGLQSSWHHIDGQDIDASNIQFANVVLAALQTMNQLAAADDDQDNRAKTDKSVHLKTDENPVKPNPLPFKPTPLINELVSVQSQALAKADYKKQLHSKQHILAELIRERGQRHIIFVFEGMDAAGKGGAIRRIIAPLDPREFTIHAISAPTEDELKHAYLWRFWTRLPHDEMADVDIVYLSQKFKRNKCVALLKQRLHNSRVTIFDRSWYGRVLVERIEGFAKEADWQRAYGEINRFENDLVQSNAIVVKFWLAISEEEELKRFRAREETPNKQFKITDDDWRNRAKWHEYVQAASDMIHLTHHKKRPWYVIATDDKYTARLKILDAIISELSKNL
ncbi:ATPase [Moraxella osloensis]|uniref:ATPase n=1 Tax=Faucicola osloensis TaxID=34062 RepID=A0AAW6TF57_FAUOS|nr:ATPase [Moraxella osloensis]MDI4508887.1 ATPase [Moraxella osloensis]